MIVVEVMGGLGNQLQQYALYRKMKHLGREARLDVSWFLDEKRQSSVLAGRKLELSWFEGLPMECCSRAEREALLGKDSFTGKLKRRLWPKTCRIFRESGMYHPEIFAMDEVYLSGFWACEKYYADILPKLRESIVFPRKSRMQGNGEDALFARNAELMRKMESETSVSLHIRRGDYLDPHNAALFGGICTEEYYDGAIRYIRERCPDAHFYLFSDDPGYAREKYRGKEFTTVDWNTGENSLFDMQLMSRCRHNICANSTFSFWGARLNENPDKLMIRPSRHKNGQEAGPERMKELWAGWVLLDGEGRGI
ncbi:MAG: alpha-1,2-fucosyltransferase [Eubacteriales bacterium]|nr:alpha-1,2-fucosyltransferase [Eubacteriales bacterium]